MSEESGLFDELRDLVVAELVANAYFSDEEAETPKVLPVLPEHLGDLVNEINQKISAIGISTLVMVRSMKPGQSGLSRIVRVVVGITENSIINRATTGTGKPASDVGLMVDTILTGWRPSELWTPFKFIGIEPVAVTNPLIYEVEFETQFVRKVVSI